MPLMRDADGRADGRRPVTTGDFEAIMTDASNRGLDVDYARKRGPDAVRFRRAGGKSRFFVMRRAKLRRRAGTRVFVMRDGELVEV